VGLNIKKDFKRHEAVTYKSAGKKVGLPIRLYLLISLLKMKACINTNQKAIKTFTWGLNAFSNGMGMSSFAKGSIKLKLSVSGIFIKKPTRNSADTIIRNRIFKGLRRLN
jgi:hypothetical protein